MSFATRIMTFIFISVSYVTCHVTCMYAYEFESKSYTCLRKCELYTYANDELD